MKHFQTKLLAAAMVCLHGAALAQGESKIDTASFEAEGLPSLTFSQAQYSESWQDGLNSLGFRVGFLGSTTYGKGRILFKNSLDAAYAKSKEGGAEVFTKNEDRLNFNSALGYSITPGSPFYWAAQVDLKTQFDKGYDDVNDALHENPISNFFAPANIIASLGVRYQSDFGFSAMLSPISWRFTIVSDTAYCKYIDTDLAANPRNVRAQMGAYAQLAYDKNINKYVGIKSTLDLFSCYKDNPKANIDVDWVVSANFSLNSWLSVVFFNRVVYRDIDRYVDKDGVVKGPRIQWQESLNIGFAYKFATK